MRDGVQGQVREQTHGDPYCLCEEGGEEFGWLEFDFVEAGVPAVAEDAVEEVCPYCLDCQPFTNNMLQRGQTYTA